MDIAAWLQSLGLARSGSKPASPSPLAWSSPQSGDLAKNGGEITHAPL
jgi:hypothetical protein